MRILVTGASGFVGAELIPRLRADGHEPIALARDRARVRADVPIVEGDVVRGQGLDAALDGIEVAYYLIHSMEAAPVDQSANGARPFADRERKAAEEFSRAAQRAGVRRLVYLGGPVPRDVSPSPHLASRVAVEETLLGAVDEAVALRAPIVIGARSRPFRFIVRLVERMPVMALPAWRRNRTRPIDRRDMIEYLARAATLPLERPLSIDVFGPELVTYEDLIHRIRDTLVVGRPSLRLRFSATPAASRVAAVIAGEDHALIGPLMESLEHELLPRDERAPELFGVRLHSLDAAIERALAEWEAVEPLAAR